MSGKLRQLSLVLMLILMIVTNFNAGDRFFEFGASDNPFRNRAVFVVIWLLCLGAVLGAAVIKSTTSRLLLALPFAVATFSDVSYRMVTDTHLHYGELYSMWLARDNAKSALLSYWTSLIPAVLISITFLALMVALPVWSGRFKWLSALYLLMYPIPFVLIGLAISLKGGAAALGLPIQVGPVGMFGSILHSQWVEDFDDLRRPADTVALLKDRSMPHIVVIMDESVRGDYLSINQKSMKTTPFLDSQRVRIANFGISSSAFDCSHYSNATVRYGANSTYPRDSLLRNPSIWSYALQAGYTNSYIDAQKRHGQLQNLMTIKERELIKNFVQYNDVEPVERGEDFIRKDLRLAKDLRNLLQESQPQFIMVNKEGVHTPYEGKYPVERSQFTPHMTLRESISEGLAPERLKNSYRNAVSWSVDEFFSTLASGTDFRNAVILYTSDHGQNLLDKGIPTHCAQPLPHLGVASVPLFVFSDHEAWMTKFKEAAELNYNKASHFNVFGTLLTLMGYPVEQLSFRYDPSLLVPLSGERFFFTGDLLRGDLRKIPFSTEELVGKSVLME